MILEAKISKYFFFILFTFLYSCSSSTNFTNLTGHTFGTYYDIKMFSDDDELISRQNLDSIFEGFNNSLSTYINSSIISRINNGDDIDVDDLFFDVYNKSKLLHEKTKGLFDPSIGLLLEYYGFGPNKIQNNINEDSIYNIMMSVGFDKISINDRKLYKQDRRTKLDFNAIAKGYAVDVISNYIESKGVSNYLIDIGGEIKSSGKNVLKNLNWKIAINNPDLNSDSNYYKILELQNISIATSGNYRNYKIDSISGKKYVHTINPINGKSQETNVLSASVISKSCFTADAFATAMMVGDIDNAIKLTEDNHEIDSFIIYVDSLNNVTEYASFGFKKLFINP